MIALQINAPVGKHQKESVSGHLRFSKINVFRVKIFDSSHGFSAQSETCEDPDLNSSHAHIQQWYQWIVSSCSTKVCMLRPSCRNFSRNLPTIQVSKLQMSFVTCTQT